MNGEITFVTDEADTITVEMDGDTKWTSGVLRPMVSISVYESEPDTGACVCLDATDARVLAATILAAAIEIERDLARLGATKSAAGQG